MVKHMLIIFLRILVPSLAFLVIALCYTSQNNGVVERKNKILVEIARFMLHSNGMDYHFWAKVVKVVKVVSCPC